MSSLRAEIFRSIHTPNGTPPAGFAFPYRNFFSLIDFMSLESLIRSEALPPDFIKVVDEIYRPLAHRVAAWHQGGPMLLGINGGQGTGKSTLSLFLQSLLEDEFRLPTAILSMDDLYLTRSERKALSRAVHPLLMTRGVPGTHDVGLGIRIIETLMQAREGSATALPRFDKSHDERAPVETWPIFRGRAMVVILEGWCVGARPQEAADLLHPVNDLERIEDANATWRTYVNDALRTCYRPLFERIQRLVFLRAPDMRCIRRWRGNQEHKLRARLAGDNRHASRVMNDSELDRFIQHYQRLTEHQWRDLPNKADILLELNENQRIAQVLWGKDTS